MNSKGSNVSREREVGQRRQEALVIEDVRSAKIHLNARHYDCERMTHSEALSSNHAITEKLRNREYSVLWISTPADWHYKMLNITKWIKLSDSTGLLVMIFGLLGFFEKIDEAIQERKMKEYKVHICLCGLQDDKAPSGI